MSRAMVYELMACGALRSFRVDGCRRVRTDDLVAFVANLDERWPDHVCTRGQELPHIPGPGDQLYVSGAAFPFRAPRADPEQARTEAGNLTYDKTDWPHGGRRARVRGIASTRGPLRRAGDAVLGEGAYPGRTPVPHV